MSENKFCIYCGTPLENDWLFCKECGKPIQKNHVVEEVITDLDDNQETLDVVDTYDIEEETLEEVSEEIIYNHNRNHIVDLYNRVARRNSLRVFNIFLPIFLIMIINFSSITVGIGAIVLCLIAVGAILINNSYKRSTEILSLGTTKIELFEEGFIIEEKNEQLYERAIVNFEDIVNVEENDAIMIINTKFNRVYIIDKQSLKGELLIVRNKILKNAKTYNGAKIKQHQVAEGRYDYYPETKYTTTVTSAKEKSTLMMMIVIFSAVCLFALGVMFRMELLLLFIPIGIINLIYIKKLNNKIQGKFKIVGEKILTIILMCVQGLIGSLYLLEFIGSLL